MSELGLLAGILWRNELDLDLQQRSYRRRRGLHPWARTHTGPLEGRLQLRIQQGTDDGGNLCWQLSLVWVSGTIPAYDLWADGNASELRTDGRELSERLGLPLSEG